MVLFEQSIILNVTPQEAFDWHERTGAFQRLNPPWDPVTILQSQGGIQNSATVRLKTQGFPMSTTWEIQHQNYQAGVQFEDNLLSGPFAKWHHTHHFAPVGQHQTCLTDTIDLALPLHGLTWPVMGFWVMQKLSRVFEYRHAITQMDLDTWTQYRDQPRLKIAITGASGLVGRALVPFLSTQGHTVYKLVRHPAHGPDEIYWNPDAGEIEAHKLNGLDAVIHLAGENIASGRWTAVQKQKIRDSRVKGTQLLSETLAQLLDPPKTFVTSSAIGFYGHRGDTPLTEASDHGTGFLPDVCRAWEAATYAAEQAGIRVVKLRTGIVLDPRGGALARMLPVFLLGGGGPLGNGHQIQSWIALEDLIGAFYHALMTPGLVGPVNATAPHPVSNAQWTKALGQVLCRPTFAPAPAVVLKAMLGEMGQALLLDSSLVLPQKLQETGYVFRFPEIDGALRFMLGKGV